MSVPCAPKASGSGRLAEAEAAVRWAMRRNRTVPCRNNYAQLLECACRLSARSEPPNANELRKTARAGGADPAWWPRLSRLLLIDEPELLAAVGRPHYCRELDSASGSALLRIWFRRITGRPPTVRAWQHARKDEGR